jgi:hypothetical protein
MPGPSSSTSHPAPASPPKSDLRQPRKSKKGKSHAPNPHDPTFPLPSNTDCQQHVFLMTRGDGL